MNLQEMLVKLVKGGRKYNSAIYLGKFEGLDIKLTKNNLPFLDLEGSINYLFHKQNQMVQSKGIQDIKMWLLERSFREVEQLAKNLLDCIILRQRSMDEALFHQADVQHLIMMNALHWHLHDIMHNVPSMLNRKYFYEGNENLKEQLITQFVVPFKVLQLVVSEMPGEYLPGGVYLLKWFDIEKELEK